MSRARLAALAAALLAAAPRAALACPVCAGSSDRNAAAFGATTIFLSAIPLATVFGFAAYLRRRIRQLETPADPAPESPR